MQASMQAVIPRYPQAYFEGSIPLNAKDVARIEAQWAAEAQAAVDAVTKLATAKGVKAKGVVSRSDIVSDAIIAAAKNKRLSWWSWPHTAAGASSDCSWAVKHNKSRRTVMSPSWYYAENKFLC